MSVNLEGPQFSSNPIARGLNVGVFGKITSTSNHKQRVTITISATSDCDETQYLIGQSSLNLEVGEARFLGVSWPIPVGACLGNYTVLLEVEAKNELVASAEGVLVVTS